MTHFFPSPLKCSTTSRFFFLWKEIHPLFLGMDRVQCSSLYLYGKIMWHDTSLTFWTCSLKGDASWRGFHRKWNEAMCALWCSILIWTGDRQTEKYTPMYKKTHIARQTLTQTGWPDKDTGNEAAMQTDSSGVIYTDLLCFFQQLKSFSFKACETFCIIKLCTQ